VTLADLTRGVMPATLIDKARFTGDTEQATSTTRV
jgi:hypothetical protein